MNHSAPSILVVDDEVDTCRNLEDIFTDLGYEVDIASNGPAALDLVEKKPYDVALLDLKMPGMDGLTLYRRIKKLRAGTEAILVTAFAASGTADEAVAAGILQVLPKPVDIGRLLSLLNQTLSHPLALIVDDDEDLCASLRDLMREQGYRVCLAHDEGQAAERLKGRDYEVVLIDMRLPQGDGRSVFALVKAANPLTHTVIITGCRIETEPLVQQVVAGGADAVCYKPFDVPALLNTIKRLSAHHA